MPVTTVAMLTAGGLAPCLSSAVGGLIERYTEVAPDVRIIAYRNGYAGLLTGDSVAVTDAVRPGVVASEKGAWLSTSRTGQTISALVSADTRADIALGACFNDTRVEVGAATAWPG